MRPRNVSWTWNNTCKHCKVFLEHRTWIQIQKRIIKLILGDWDTERGVVTHILKIGESKQTESGGQCVERVNGEIDPTVSNGGAEGGRVASGNLKESLQLRLFHHRGFGVESAAIPSSASLGHCANNGIALMQLGESVGERNSNCDSASREDGEGRSKEWGQSEALHCWSKRCGAGVSKMGSVMSNSEGEGYYGHCWIEISACFFFFIIIVSWTEHILFERIYDTVSIQTNDVFVRAFWWAPPPSFLCHRLFVTPAALCWNHVWVLFGSGVVFCSSFPLYFSTAPLFFYIVRFYPFLFIYKPFNLQIIHSSPPLLFIFNMGFFLKDLAKTKD